MQPLSAAGLQLQQAPGTSNGALKALQAPRAGAGRQGAAAALPLPTVGLPGGATGSWCSAVRQDATGGAGRRCDSPGDGAQRASRCWRPRARLPAANDTERMCSCRVPYRDSANCGGGGSSARRPARAARCVLAGWTYASANNNHVCRSFEPTWQQYSAGVSGRGLFAREQRYAVRQHWGLPPRFAAARRSFLPPCHRPRDTTGSAALECSAWCDERAGVVTLVGPSVTMARHPEWWRSNATRRPKRQQAAAAAPCTTNTSTVPWFPSRPISTSFLGD